MKSIMTDGRALRLAAILSAGVAFGAGLPASVAEGAQDVAALGEKLARSESQAERLKIVADLGRSRDPAALEHILSVINEENLAVRKRAVSAVVSVLKAAGGDGPARLLVDEALSADLSATGQLEVVGILNKLSPPKAAARALLRFIDRGDLAENVARLCVHALAKPRYADLDAARDGLLELVEEGDTTVAVAAASALGRMRMSGSDKEEVVTVLVERLGGGEEDAAVRESARKSLGLVTGEGEKSTHEWRTWAVKEGYGDPVEPVSDEDLAAARPPVIITRPIDTGSAGVSSLIYVAVGTVAVALVAILLLLRTAFTKRSADSIEARRRKTRRRS